MTETQELIRAIETLERIAPTLIENNILLARRNGDGDTWYRFTFERLNMMRDYLRTKSGTTHLVP